MLELIVILLIILLTWHKWKLGYWKRKGIPGPDPLLIFGNMKDFVFSNKIPGEIVRDIYLELKSKGARHGGAYFFGLPIYIPTDLEVIKNILQVDCAYFSNRGLYTNEKCDILFTNIFGQEGSKWQNMRNKVTTAFSAKKVKAMCETMLICSHNFKEEINNCTRDNIVDIKDIAVRYTTDVVGSCLFGFPVKSLLNPKDEFKLYGHKVLGGDDLSVILKIIITFILPHEILRVTNYKACPDDVYNFFQEHIQLNMETRKKNNISGNDLMGVILELYNNKSSSALDSSEDMTMLEVVAESFIFFISGYITSSITISMAAYELGLNQELQEKLREEIEAVLKRHNNELSYDAIADMKYLDGVVRETFRKYPSKQFFTRNCTKDYLFQKEDIVLEKGTMVIIPTLGIYYNPEYYPDPEKFDPDRFKEENKAKLPNFAYMPFGEGPRSCVALRFGMMQIKIGIITLVKNFKFTLNKKTVIPVVFRKSAPLATIKGGVWLNLEKIPTSS